MSRRDDVKEDSSSLNTVLMKKTYIDHVKSKLKERTGLDVDVQLWKRKCPCPEKDFPDMRTYHTMQDDIIRFLTPFYGVMVSGNGHQFPYRLVPPYLLKAFEFGVGVQVTNRVSGLDGLVVIQSILVDTERGRVMLEVEGQGRFSTVHLSDYNTLLSVDSKELELAVNG
jgi:hypothetical protein